MELKELIAQIFGLIGMAVAILSYQGKTGVSWKTR